MTVSMKKYPAKSLLVCIAGTNLTNEEKLRLKHPLVNGVILFSRNFENSYQLKELVDSIKSVSETPLLVAVDNEGGRVQRFKSDGFTHLPAMAELYRYFASLTNAQRSERDKQSDSKTSYDQPSTKCLEAVNDIGYLMAFECLSHGIDLSFAPVMDIDQGSDVIGDRAFHESPDIAARLVNAFCTGMRMAGMPTVGKHFPGHGSTKEDSHFHTPVDTREWTEIKENDLKVFETLLSKNIIDGIMPAHIIFDRIDKEPVGYSKFWLQKVLKEDLKFKGIIFSDDLAMVGAGVSAKNPLCYLERYEKAIEAGCDIALLCNKPDDVDLLLSQIKPSDVSQIKNNNGFKIGSQTNTAIYRDKLDAAKDVIKKINEWKSA